MADSLKTFFSPALVRRLAADLARTHSAFPVDAFVAQASRGLNRLELLDRSRHITRALATHLPKPYPKGVAVLLRSLGPEHASDELLGLGMAPFFYLPHTMFVAEHGRGALREGQRPGRAEGVQAEARHPASWRARGFHDPRVAGRAHHTEAVSRPPRGGRGRQRAGHASRRLRGDASDGCCRACFGPGYLCLSYL